MDLFRKIVFLILVSFVAADAFAQKKPSPKNKKDSPKTTRTQQRAKIEILQANVAKFDTAYSEAHRLIGNVIFKHENMLMFCDSARFYEKESRIKAYGHIHVQQGDTLNVYADSLDYNGNTKLAKLRGHIRMVEKDLVMTCDSVDFDAKKSIGVYKGGATITSAKNKNTLTSQTGYYHSKTKDFYFKDNVVLKNADSELRTDTLRYNVGNETAYFIAATKITTKDTGEITTTLGWFDTRKDQSAFYNRSLLKKKEKTITADTILYDQRKGIGNLYGKAWMYDTTDKVGLFGNYAFYNEKKEEVLITRNAYMVRKFTKDTFYLKADTIFSVRDTNDLTTVKAYNHVKFYKGDLLGKADSLIYSDHDSLIKFFRDPALWQDKNQLTGDFMQARIIDNKINQITIINNSFIISKADTAGFNQVKGRNIYAYFKDEEITKIKVEGNGQTLYYIGEEGKAYSAINRADCSDLIMYTNNGKIKRITFVYQPEATAYPINKYPANEKLLKNFKWLEDQKPSEMDFKPVIDFLTNEQ